VFDSSRRLHSPSGVSSPSRDLVSVCVCTYRRRALLTGLLAQLGTQPTADRFDVEIVVIENDADRQSEATVAEAALDSPVPIHYDCEPERNIALARNRAVRTARGRLVALIDDDETPTQDWLLRHYETLQSTHAHGVLGPVVPLIAGEAPTWLAATGVLDRPRRATGTAIGPQDMRTGNALLHRHIFTDGGLWFDPALGRSGGEDSDFFTRCVAAGHKLVWCDEAVVSEVVPPERWTARFQLRRMWRSGTIRGQWIHDDRQSWSLAVRGIAYLVAGLLALPFSLLTPKAWRMRLALKVAYFGGVVTAACGWATLRNRE
jgi:succinoglycan biosynthesis protein ExoM